MTCCIKWLRTSFLLYSLPCFYSLLLSLYIFVQDVSINMYDRELILGIQNNKDNVYRGIETGYLNWQWLVWWNWEQTFCCLILLCLSLYNFCQRYWPYALKALKRGYSQIFWQFLLELKWYMQLLLEPAIATMHGPHSVFDIVHCTVIHCDAGGVSLVDQWKAEKNWLSFNWPITRCYHKPIKVGLI